MIGQLLDRRYRIIKLLNSGALGQTYLAADTHRPGYPHCIVKQIQPSSKNARMLPIIQNLWRKKAENLEKLGKHDRISQLLAFFQEGGNLYLVEEHIQGVFLSEELAPAQPISPEKTIALLDEILEVLVFVHGQGVLHGNIQPANFIRRSADGKLVLVNFDSFQKLGTPTPAGAIAVEALPRNGTAQSPEQNGGSTGRSPAVSSPMPANPANSDVAAADAVLPNNDLYGVGLIGIQALAGVATEELLKLRHETSGKIPWRDRLPNPSDTAPPRPNSPEAAAKERQAKLTADLADLLDELVAPPANDRQHLSAEAALQKLRSLEPPEPVVAPVPAKSPKLEEPPAPPPKPAEGKPSGIGAGLKSVGESLQSVKASLTPTPAATQETAPEARSPKGKWWLWGLAVAAAIVPIYALYLWSTRARTWQTQGVRNAEEGNLQEAIAAFDKSLQIDRSNPGAYYERANAHYDLGNFDEAIADYTNAIELDPRNTNAYYNRGLAYYDTGKYRNAILDFGRVLQLQPDDSEAYYQRGLSQYQLGDYKAAIEDYSEATRLDPENSNVYISRGLARSAAGDKQGAIDDYTLVIGMNPEDADAYYSRGRARFYLGDYKGAKDDYDRAIALEPENPSAYTNRCSVYLNLAEYDNALTDCTTAIRLDSREVAAYTNRCIAYLNLKNYPSAVADCTQAIQLRPNQAKNYSNRGLARSQAEDYEGAIDDYTEAIRLNPNDAVAYSNRAIAHELLGDTGKAVEDFAQAVRINPDFAKAYYHRGLTRLKLEDLIGAEEDFKTAAKLCLDQGLIGCYNDAQFQLKGM